MLRHDVIRIYKTNAFSMSTIQTIISSGRHTCIPWKRHDTETAVVTRIFLENINARVCRRIIDTKTFPAFKRLTPNGIKTFFKIS